MTQWRKLSNKELVSEFMRPFADDYELIGDDQLARVIREAARRLMLPKSRREKPQERRSRLPRRDQ